MDHEDPESQTMNNIGRYNRLNEDGSSKRRRFLRAGYAFLIKHKTIACATFFLILDCISIVLSHFETRSWVYTMVTFVLSSSVVIISVATYLFDQCDIDNARIEADARVIRELEVIFSILQFSIAFYNLVMEFQNISNDFYKIDRFAPIAFPLYVLFYLVRDWIEKKYSSDTKDQDASSSVNDIENPPTTETAERDHFRLVTPGNSTGSINLAAVNGDQEKHHLRPLSQIIIEKSSSSTSSSGAHSSVPINHLAVVRPTHTDSTHEHETVIQANEKALPTDSRSSSLTQAGTINEGKRGYMSDDSVTSTSTSISKSHYDQANKNTLETTNQLSRRITKSWAITVVLKERKDRVGEILNQRDAISSELQRGNLTWTEINEPSTLKKRLAEFGINPAELREWNRDVIPYIESEPGASVDQYDVMIETTTDLQDDSLPLIMTMKFPPLDTKKWVLKMKIHCETCKQGVWILLQKHDEEGSIDTKLGEQETLIATGNADISQLLKKLLHAGSDHVKPIASLLPDDKTRITKNEKLA